MMKRFRYLLLLIVLYNIQAQEISMNFPKFAGKNYDFIIFQGPNQKTIVQGTIPPDGKFVLSIPAEYRLYTGMSRWLITGTKEGGGLDMFIPGHNFSVSCLDSQPNENNIIYVNNSGNNELNKIYKLQEGILSRYQSMLLATKSYDVSDSHYSLFKSELNKQIQAYMLFQQNLREKKDYISRLLVIINISHGKGLRLTDSENQKGKDIARYISHTLDWDALYTSGYWSEVIQGFAGIHSNVLKDSLAFEEDFKMISSRITSPEVYTDFCERLSYYLQQLGKNDYLEIMAAAKLNK
ncbi:alkyl hydroperoxide reductase [Elizabethkingia anophelis]